MAATTTRKRRIKVNFMISDTVLDLLKKFIEPGERSDFVNSALESHLKNHKKALGAHLMNKFRAAHKLHFTDAQILDAKNYGRK